MNDRAILYRKMEGIPAEWGTAVNVQAMVFGNMGETSATGVCFCRDAATGEDIFIGEYLINAQGEDIVVWYPYSTTNYKEGSQRWAVLADVPEAERVCKISFDGRKQCLLSIKNWTYQTKLENHYKTCRIWNLPLKVNCGSYKPIIVNVQVLQW